MHQYKSLLNHTQLRYISIFQACARGNWGLQVRIGFPPCGPRLSVCWHLYRRISLTCTQIHDGLPRCPDLQVWRPKTLANPPLHHRLHSSCHGRGLLLLQVTMEMVVGGGGGDNGDGGGGYG